MGTPAFLNDTPPRQWTWTRQGSHKCQASSWLPPRENWDPGNTGLPFGWEAAIDKNGRNYFINHCEGYTTRDDPRNDPDYIEPPKPREVELTRDPIKGFGFVAGSEKPVIVRFVTEGGPSVGLLLPGDQLLKINGQDIKKAPREYVIDLVRSCKNIINLTVCQPYSDNSTRKSALLTAAKKAKLKSNPSRVRFAEPVILNGSSPTSDDSTEESYVPFMPNVLKVFMENGQTKSFKYDNKTTVKDVMQSLQEKLNIHNIHNFCLVLHSAKSKVTGKMTILQEHETLSEIAARPGACNFRCLFRVVFVPRDAYDLLKEDPVAFEYFYLQCCNDVIQERFASELKPEIILRLAALHISQHAASSNIIGKINIKTIEKETGLDKFVPGSLMEKIRGKDLRKLLTHALKQVQSLMPPGQKQLTAIQAKLHYMKIVSELKTFGSRVFMVTLLDKKTENMLLVGPKAGISLVTNIKFYTLSMFADFSEIECLKVMKEKDNMTRVEVTIKGQKVLNLGLLKEDAPNFVSLVEGYCRLYVDPNKKLVERNASKQSEDPEIPPYHSKHRVLTAPWSYPDDIVSMAIENGETSEFERIVDLARGPPAYEENEEYIARIKQDLGIKSTNIKETKAVKNKTNQTLLSNGTSNTPSGINQPISNGTLPNVYSPALPMKTVITVTSDHHNRNSKMVSEQETDSIASSSSAVSQSSEESRTLSEKSGFPSSATWQSQMDDCVLPGSQIILNEKETAKKVDNGENNSDTDSGVGADNDRQIPAQVMKNPVVMRSMSLETESDDTDSLGTPRDSPIASSLPLNTELHLDLSCVPGFEFGFEESSPSFPDPNSTSFIPFNHENLYFESKEEVNNPRMFYVQEPYFDPDIIDLTLLPPFPPTEEELREMEASLSAQQSSFPFELHHTQLMKTVSVLQESSYHDMHMPLNKSASVEEYPDFLDADIDSFIEQLTVPPPPPKSEPPPLLTKKGSTESVMEVVEINYQPVINHTWDGTLLNYYVDSRVFSPQSDLYDPDLNADQVLIDTVQDFSSLVIPPPPGEESNIIEKIAIVPPISTVAKAKNRRKKDRHQRTSSVDIFFKQFGSETVEEILARKDKVVASGAELRKELGIGQLSDQGSSTSDSGCYSVGDSKDEDHSSSPASVSEKLNQLLKSLSIYEPVSTEQELGKFRRTSSLRLGRSVSLDQIMKAADISQNSNTTSSLQTGSVRITNHRRSSLNITADSKSVTSDGQKGVEYPTASSKEPIFSSGLKRNNSFNIRPRDENNSDEKESKPSFASLKAKLESCKASLMGKTVHRDSSNKSSLDGDLSRRSIRRTGSFSKLFRGSQENLKDDIGSMPSVPKPLHKPKDDGKSIDSQSVPSSSKDSKDPKLMLNSLAVPRTSFRPNAGNASSQFNKKSGPMKALCNVFDTDDKSKNSKPDVPPRRQKKAPPRPTHPASHKPIAKSISLDLETQSKQQSKDDSQLNSSKPSISKTMSSPYATVGKMWRPMSMSSDISEKDSVDTYRTYNNFDVLRDSSVSGNEREEHSFNSKLTNGDLGPTLIFSSTSIGIEGTPSRKSLALLKQKHHPGSVEEILDKKYSVNDFSKATGDIDTLLLELRHAMESLKSSRIDKNQVQFDMCKEELEVKTRQFVTDAKLLVSNAAHTKEKLAVHMDISMHTLAKIFLHGQATMLMMQGVHQGQHLGSEIIRVANAYKSTLNAAHAAIGKPIQDPHMKYLMRQATNLASLLSNLLKTLKTLHQK
ncbi:hypothetical protein CHS0354_021016 [Potamilus streckersoni]|uniref:FERM and PDZ domain-containing protein 4 n=1 Tax=Potamilus streckersoni TaxID=2493646 RepID=A0AAE0SQT1_9BIVA|nr:hypothetical protein CHS0354_021016 [Potamilus streckersoni]